MAWSWVWSPEPININKYKPDGLLHACNPGSEAAEIGKALGLTSQPGYLNLLSKFQPQWDTLSPERTVTEVWHLGLSPGLPCIHAHRVVHVCVSRTQVHLTSRANSHIPLPNKEVWWDTHHQSELSLKDKHHPRWTAFKGLLRTGDTGDAHWESWV